MNRALFLHELKSLLGTRLGRLVISLVLVMGLFAAYSGYSWRSEQAQNLQGHMASYSKWGHEWRNRLLEAEGREPEPYTGPQIEFAHGDSHFDEDEGFDGHGSESELAGEGEESSHEGEEEGFEEEFMNSTHPMDMQRPVALQPGALSDFAVGHADLQPKLASASPWRNNTSLFEKYQFGNPNTLSVGLFDFSFLLLIIMPLLMIVLSFDVLASDRSSGRLRLLLTQSVSLSSLVLTRLLTRNLVLVLAVFVTMLVALLLFSVDAERLARFGLWLLVAAVYLSFWFGLIYWVVSHVRRSEACAAVLITVWAILTLAVPALVGGTADGLYPAPSRLAYLSEARAAEQEANEETAELTEDFLPDHMELFVDEMEEGEEEDFYPGAYWANRTVIEKTAEVEAGFDQSQADRNQFLNGLQYLSPFISTQRQLFAIAGTDLERHLVFRQQVRSLLEATLLAIESAVEKGGAYTVAEYDALPKLGDTDKSTSDILRNMLPSLLYILLISLALIILSQRRLRDTEWQTF